ATKRRTIPRRPCATTKNISRCFQTPPTRKKSAKKSTNSPRSKTPPEKCFRLSSRTESRAFSFPSRPATAGRGGGGAQCRDLLFVNVGENGNGAGDEKPPPAPEP